MHIITLVQLGVPKAKPERTPSYMLVLWFSQKARIIMSS